MTFEEMKLLKTILKDYTKVSKTCLAVIRNRKLFDDLENIDAAEEDILKQYYSLFYKAHEQVSNIMYSKDSLEIRGAKISKLLNDLKARGLLDSEFLEGES